MNYVEMRIPLRREEAIRVVIAANKYGFAKNMSNENLFSELLSDYYHFIRLAENAVQPTDIAQDYTPVTNAIILMRESAFKKLSENRIPFCELSLKEKALLLEAEASKRYSVVSVRNHLKDNEFLKPHTTGGWSPSSIYRVIDNGDKLREELSSKESLLGELKIEIDQLKKEV